MNTKSFLYLSATLVTGIISHPAYTMNGNDITVNIPSVQKTIGVKKKETKNGDTTETTEEVNVGKTIGQGSFSVSAPGLLKLLRW